MMEKPVLQVFLIPAVIETLVASITLESNPFAAVGALDCFLVGWWVGDLIYSLSLAHIPFC